MVIERLGDRCDLAHEQPCLRKVIERNRTTHMRAIDELPFRMVDGNRPDFVGVEQYWASHVSQEGRRTDPPLLLPEP